MPESVQIGELLVGKNFPVRIQSMLTTNTSDTNSCVNQISQLYEQGCDMVRLSARSVQDARNLYNIKNKLHKNNINIPLIADVHFNPKIAEIAAGIVEKVRINPGNYIDKDNNRLKDASMEDINNQIAANLFSLTEICKKHGTVLRIGSNQGSLSKRIVNIYGDTARGMIASILEYLEIFKLLKYDNLVISLKSSNPLIMIEANRLFYNTMQDRKEFFPLHLGVTEAGSGIEGRIKSAAGIGALLAEGIGNTIRVSLSENPVNEIMPAKEIASIKPIVNIPSIDVESAYSKEKFVVTNKDIDVKNNIITIDVSCKTLNDACKILNERFISHSTFIKYNSSESYIIDCIFLSYILLSYPISGLITNIENEVIENVLQTLKIKIFKPEYISCPTCARTEYDLFKVLETVKIKTKKLKNMTIAVMGCIVNGPGEMKGANFGVLGHGKGKLIFYLDGNPLGNPFPQEELDAKLDDFINAHFKD